MGFARAEEGPYHLPFPTHRWCFQSLCMRTIFRCLWVPLSVPDTICQVLTSQEWIEDIESTIHTIVAITMVAITITPITTDWEDQSIDIATILTRGVCDLLIMTAMTSLLVMSLTTMTILDDAVTAVDIEMTEAGRANENGAVVTSVNMTTSVSERQSGEFAGWKKMLAIKRLSECSRLWWRTSVLKRNDCDFSEPSSNSRMMTLKFHMVVAETCDACTMVAHAASTRPLVMVVNTVMAADGTISMADRIVVTAVTTMVFIGLLATNMTISHASLVDTIEVVVGTEDKGRNLQVVRATLARIGVRIVLSLSTTKLFFISGPISHIDLPLLLISYF
jgi:hypothetical protein